MSADAPPGLILASASPRRRALLAKAGVRFEVTPADIDESPASGEAPAALVTRLARAKAAHVAEQRRNAFVLGADTIVALGTRVLGKPRDETHAVEILEALAGHTHSVITGVALATPQGDWLETCVSSQVTFHPASRGTLETYVGKGESLDKAGGYAYQGRGRALVAGVEGSETNIIGLPLDETLEMLRRSGFGGVTA